MISEQIARLQQAKADIKAAIEAKGVEVPSSALIDTYDDYIAQIEGGGGCSVASANSITFDAMGRVSSVSYKEGVTSISDYMFAYNPSISSVTLPSTIRTIGNAAFQNCGSLVSINLPEGLTTIGWMAFNLCTGLTSLSIPSSVTSIDADAFYGCSGLTGITVNAVVPPQLGSNNVFGNTNNCPIIVPCQSVDAYKAATNWSNYASRIQSSGCGIRMSGTSVSGSSFQIRINDGAENINAVVDTVPNQDGTYNWTAEYEGDITSTTRMFASTPIVTLDWGTFRPTELGTQMFLSAKLTAFTIPDSVTTIQSAAVNNNRITSLTIPTGVTTINGDAFAANGSLTGITFLSTTVPNGITWSTFAGSTCPIYVPCNSYTSYRSMANSAFSERVTPSGGSTRWTTAEDQTACVDGIDVYSVLKLQYSCDNENWIDAGLTKTGTKIRDGYRRWVTVQGEYICEDGDKYTVEKEQGSCDNENWTDIGNSRKGTLIETGSQDCQTSCDCQYNFCGEDAVGEEFTVNNGTNEIKSTDFDSHSPVRGTVGSLTTTIREYCFGRSLEEITICNSVTTIEHEAFMDCENLTSITIPSSVTGIGYYAFTRCSSLQEVIFEGTTPPTFSDGNEPIYWGHFPSVTYVPDSALSDYRAIRNWVGDTEDVFDPITNIRPISERGCDCQYNFCGEDERGEEITVNDGTSTLNSSDFSNSPARGTVGSLTTTIGAYCFGRSLEEITLCNSVTTFEHEAFMECENLTSITIPSSVQTIGYWAFTRCSSLQEVIFEGTTPPTFDTGYFNGIYNGFYPSVTYVPDSALNDYRAIENWADGDGAEHFDPMINIKPISERV